jgi:hypothetical protein
MQLFSTNIGQIEENTCINNAAPIGKVKRYKNQSGDDESIDTGTTVEGKKTNIQVMKEQL